jgi:hypothetical protein
LRQVVRAKSRSPRPLLNLAYWLAADAGGMGVDGMAVPPGFDAGGLGVRWSHAPSAINSAMATT